MTSTELITEHCGRFNVDILSGWEAGMLGKTRIGGRLTDRSPPPHFYLEQNSSRFSDWMFGRDTAYALRKKMNDKKCVVFMGVNADGVSVEVKRTGWNVSRSKVINQMAKEGVVGDVYVYYQDYNNILAPLKRTVVCGI